MAYATKDDGVNYATEVKLSQVDAQLNQLSAEGERLEQLVKELEDRLSSVLSPRLPEPNEAAYNNVEKIPLVPLASRMQVHTQNHAETSRRVESMIRRLEL